MEPTLVDALVFWEPQHHMPEEIEAVRPDGIRVRPTMQLGGRRLGFDEPLPVGTKIFLGGAITWVVANLPPLSV